MKLRCRVGTTSGMLRFKIVQIGVDKFTVSQLEYLLNIARENIKLAEDYELKVQDDANKYSEFEKIVEPIVTKKKEIQAEYDKLAKGLEAHRFGITLGMFSITKLIYYRYYDLDKNTGGITWYKSSAKYITDKLDKLVVKFKEYDTMYLDLYKKLVPPKTVRPCSRYIDLKLGNKKVTIYSSEITVEIIVRALEYKNKKQSVLAKAAAYDGTQRQYAETVKRDIRSQLKKMHHCPYCGNDLLIDDAHADHIYPVSKGGLSTTRNMVYICSKCNLRKTDMTLRNFLKKFEIDADRVHHNLEFLGKDF